MNVLIGRYILNNNNLRDNAVSMNVKRSQGMDGIPGAIIEERLPVVGRTFINISLIIGILS